MPVVTIRISNDLLVPARIAGVVVEFYNLAGVFQTSGTTDVNGEVTATLPIAQYDVLMYKAGVSILPKQPQRIDVLIAPASNLFLVTGHVRTLPESTDPARCRITGYFLNAGGQAMKNGPRISIHPLKKLIVAPPNAVSPVDGLSVGPDTDGYYDFELLREHNYAGYIGYLDEFFGCNPAVLKLCVPDLPGLELAHLLFPVPVGIVFSASTKSIALSAGTNEEVTYVSGFSDQTEHPGNVPWAAVNLTNSDETVVQASLVCGKLVLSPLATGTATLTTSRVISDDASYLPESVFTVSTVVVTVT